MEDKDILNIIMNHPTKFLDAFIINVEDFKNDGIIKKYDNCRITFVDDVYKYVYDDDKKYAVECVKEKGIFGIYYITGEGYKELVISKNNEITEIINTLYHEYIHYLDYEHFSIFRHDTNFRKLQENNYFRYWTEFHATYITYVYAIQNFEDIDVYKVCREIISKYKRVLIDTDDFIDETVRSYGQYIALFCYFPLTIDFYPKNYFLNQDFLKVYDFLFEHQNIKKLLENFDEWVKLIDKVMKK